MQNQMPMPTTSEDIVRYFKVDRRDLVYLKFILEAYEGMSTLSTVDKRGVIVSLTIPPGFTDDMARLITALQSEITLVETTRPESLTEEPTNHA